MALLTGYTGSRDDYNNIGTSTGTGGQSFKLAANSTVDSCEINGSRGNTASGTFKIEIRDTSPTGTVLATTGTITTSSSGLAAYNAAGVDSWTVFNFSSSVALTASTTYYVVLTVLTGSSNDEVRWNVDTTSPTYSGGSEYTGTTPNINSDRLFRINGTEISSSAGGSVLLFTA